MGSRRDDSSPVWLNHYRLGGNPDSLDFYDEFEIDAIRHPDSDIASALCNIADRAWNQGYPVILGVRRFDPGESVLAIELPAGDGIRHLWVGGKNATAVAAFNFEDWQFLDRYDGVWCNKSGTVEVRVTDADGGYLMSLPGAWIRESFTLTSSEGVQVRLGPATDSVKFFLSRLHDYVFTLRFERAKFQSHADVNQLLETVGQRVLLEIDKKYGTLPLLAEIEIDDTSWFDKGPTIVRAESPIVYPDRGLQKEPFGLYAYARSLPESFPLLKFLAYYQVLEYFFPVYSTFHAAKALQGALLTPGFDTHSIGKVTKALRESLKVPHMGGRREYEQLQATLLHCVIEDQLKHFLVSTRLNGNSLVAELAVAGKQLGAPPITTDSDDNKKLLETLTKRIYILRNRIVHTKDDDHRLGRRPLFPFDFHAKKLVADTLLLRFVAASALTGPASEIETT